MNVIESTLNYSENFRLQQVSNCLSDLEKELESSDRIYKKYKRIFNILVKVSSSTFKFCLCSIIGISSRHFWIGKRFYRNLIKKDFSQSEQA